MKVQGNIEISDLFNVDAFCMMCLFQGNRHSQKLALTKLNITH